LLWCAAPNGTATQRIQCERTLSVAGAVLVCCLCTVRQLTVPRFVQSRVGEHCGVQLQEPSHRLDKDAGQATKQTDRHTQTQTHRRSLVSVCVCVQAAAAAVRRAVSKQ